MAKAADQEPTVEAATQSLQQDRTASMDEAVRIGYMTEDRSGCHWVLPAPKKDLAVAAEAAEKQESSNARE